MIELSVQSFMPRRKNKMDPLNNVVGEEIVEDDIMQVMSC